MSDNSTDPGGQRRRSPRNSRPQILGIADRLAKAKPKTKATATGVDNLTLIDASGDHRFERLQSCTSLADVAALINEWDDAEDLVESLDNAFRTGAAVRLAIARGWVARGNFEQALKAAGIRYHPSHARLCARLFDRRPDATNDAEWYRANAPKMRFTPRKHKGLDFFWDCIRAHDTFKEVKDEHRGWDDDEVFAELDNRLVRTPINKPHSTTIQQQLVRWSVVAVHALVVLAKNKIEHPLARCFGSLGALFDWTERAPWDTGTDAAAFAEVYKPALPLDQINFSTTFYDREPPDPTSDADAGADRNSESQVQADLRGGGTAEARTDPQESTSDEVEGADTDSNRQSQADQRDGGGGTSEERIERTMQRMREDGFAGTDKDLLAAAKLVLGLAHMRQDGKMTTGNGRRGRRKKAASQT